MYTTDKIILSKDVSAKPPKYYDRLFDIECCAEMEQIKEKRKEAIESCDDLRDRRRTLTINQINEKNNKLLKRGFENGKDENVFCIR